MIPIHAVFIGITNEISSNMLNISLREIQSITQWATFYLSKS